MTTATHLIALFQSHFDGDDEQFYTVAMQAAANEARRGHGKLAQQLRDLVDEARARKKTPARGKAVPLVQPKGDHIVTLYRNESRAPIPPATFEFTPPAGTTVTTPLGR